MPFSPECEIDPDARSGLYGLEPEHEIKVNIRHQLPAAIILVHGVNDIGTSYEAIEAGLCEGLTRRLDRGEVPASYRLPTKEDRDEVIPDPDAVFYRRKVVDETFSPIIPFYWGYRELTDEASTKNGQRVDRYGNRLDKDLSKGGGPFANATSSIPDMWNRGIGTVGKQMGDDPIRPIRETPGRMYMVLAAMRLAALVGIIRDRNKDDVVNIVAHSQGCLVTLLAQAILLEQGLDPADTLILTHPPYALDDSLGFIWRLARWWKGSDGIDHAMEPYYHLIDSPQTLHARLQTLVNIVGAVAKGGEKRVSSPVFSSLKEETNGGIVGKAWRAEADRDNRGKVYLYFCPEDMTVALSAVKGIGWQGVPDQITGSQVDRNRFSWTRNGKKGALRNIVRYPMQELGERFYQRVFTEKMRIDQDGTPRPELVGSGRHDFILRLEDEDDHAHVSTSNRDYRERLPSNNFGHAQLHSSDTPRHAAVRDINAEPLPKPVYADLRAGDHILPDSPELAGANLRENDRDGPLEHLDAIDAAIATAADGGIQTTWLFIHDPQAGNMDLYGSLEPSPDRAQFEGQVQPVNARKKELADRLNRGRKDEPKYVVRNVYLCLDPNSRSLKGVGFLVEHDELPDQARLRWQNSFSPKSYHSAIVGSKVNHAYVTAFDVAIGAGKAMSNHEFSYFLCAVADWRMPELRPTKKSGTAVMNWDDFLATFSTQLKEIRQEWFELIRANKDYYNKGQLPEWIPLIGRCFGDLLVCETTGGIFGEHQ
jgi:pimeloyl-ACP methyl ester carboxylesterase